ncbi:hypothetical protein CRE_29159 [Caenorhabditis remanei]|uniref:Uncharacterized protein n=1 Tax=Caenorhabditis remanei TaxID=31234 RepID=E3N9I8_CAERE|nr:hypothetical protein CRE_29159 [Caenorhabditis remanei]
MYRPTPQRNLGSQPYRVPLSQRMENNGTSFHHQDISRDRKRYRPEQSPPRDMDDEHLHDDMYTTTSSTPYPSSSQHTNNAHNLPTSSHRFHATVNQKWSPIGFAATQLYDYDRGVPLDRDTCERNLEKLIKNDRQTDYFEWLTFAQKCREEGNELLEQMALGLAFTTAKAEKTANRSQKEVKKDVPLAGIIEKRGFSLEAAAPFDTEITLPSRKFFKISDVLTPDAVSQWSSSKIEPHTRSLSLFLYDALEFSDPLFVCYGISKRAKTYVPVNPIVFAQIAEYVLAGFGQSITPDKLSYVISLANSTLENKLNRVRAEHNKKHGKNSSEEYAKWLENELKKPTSQLNRERLLFDPHRLVIPIQEPTDTTIAEGENDGSLDIVH